VQNGFAAALLMAMRLNLCSVLCALDLLDSAAILAAGFSVAA
jgi:hypothetical protein